VSTPVSWDEVAAGVRAEDFRLENVRARIASLGDLWRPLLAAKGRTDLGAFLS
jgi:DNA primase